MWARTYTLIKTDEITNGKIRIPFKDMFSAMQDTSVKILMFTVSTNHHDCYACVDHESSADGTVEVPSWFDLGTTSKVRVTRCVVPGGNFLRLKPNTYKFFLETKDQRASLEQSLSAFGCLMKGQTFPLVVEGKQWEFTVIDINTDDARSCCLIEDVELEVDLIEADDTPPPVQRPPAPAMSFSSQIGSVTAQKEDVKETKTVVFVPFAGQGRTLG